MIELLIIVLAVAVVVFLVQGARWFYWRHRYQRARLHKDPKGRKPSIAGPGAAENVRELVVMYAETNRGARGEEVSQAFRSMGEEAIQPLFDCLGDVRLRNVAAAALGSIDAPVFPYIKSWAESPDPDAQQRAIFALRWQAMRHGRSYSELRRLAESKDPNVAAVAQETSDARDSHMLGSIGQARSLVPKLVGCTFEPPTRGGMWGVVAKMARLGPSAIIVVISEAPKIGPWSTSAVLHVCGIAEMPACEEALEAFSLGMPGLALPLLLLGDFYLDRPEAVSAVRDASQTHPRREIREEAQGALEEWPDLRASTQLAEVAERIEVVSSSPESTAPLATDAPPVASVSPTASVADELSKLAALLDRGLLTPDEFAAQKAKLLGG